MDAIPSSVVVGEDAFASLAASITNASYAAAKGLECRPGFPAASASSRGDLRESVEEKTPFPEAPRPRGGERKGSCPRETYVKA